ncbi:DUF6527 family protein [Mucilaginibacter sp. SG564]|uniref:DUF6527 family protein n=1 Tax=Mucilaginibacter sp. SG564 TaxID=2587022 RepID=UPI001554E991|nr:DUF6527 family protein [Mucilaginibacter sp. SG564]NOW94758.1 hypothetical protein [Mucilaginibacter sp. SG564]
METLQHKFVDIIPEYLENGILYISIPRRTALHKCVCGCGNEVITPLSPTDWELTFNGTSVSLHPSIGNWSFKCKSHYFITENRIKHSEKWGEREIDNNRKRDKNRKDQFYKKVEENKVKTITEPIAAIKPVSKWKKFLSFWSVNITKKGGIE